MFKASLIISLLLALSSAQLFYPTIPVEVHEAFTVNDILGNYFLVGTYYNSPSPPSQNAKCFKIKMRAEPNNVAPTLSTVIMTMSYFDTLYNMPLSFDVNYISMPGNPTELYSQIDTLYNLKNYNGQNDLVVRYHGLTDGKVILQKRDKTLAYVLSRTAVGSADLTAIKARGSLLGLLPQTFVAVDNSSC